MRDSGATQFRRAKRDDPLKARKKKYCLPCMSTNFFMVPLVYSSGKEVGKFRVWEVDVFTCPVCKHQQKEYFPIAGKGTTGKEVHFETIDRANKVGQ